MFEANNLMMYLKDLKKKIPNQHQRKEIIRCGNKTKTKTIKKPNKMKSSFKKKINKQNTNLQPKKNSKKTRNGKDIIIEARETQRTIRNCYKLFKQTENLQEINSYIYKTFQIQSNQIQKSLNRPVLTI